MASCPSMAILRNLNGDGTDAVVRANGVQKVTAPASNAHLSLETGRNKLTFGYWYDYSDDREVQSFTPVGLDGRAPNLWARRKSALSPCLTGSHSMAAPSHNRAG